MKIQGQEENTVVRENSATIVNFNLKRELNYVWYLPKFITKL